jgi:predicted O-methyltransferase YrrM
VRRFIARTLGFLRRYLEALWARWLIPRNASRLTSVDDAVDFAMTVRVGHTSIAPVQNRREITLLLKRLEVERPRAILEIGVWNGGTIFLWTRVAAADATIIGVDLGGGVFGNRSPLAVVCQAFTRDDQQVRLLLRSDSHDPKTARRVQQVLDGRQLDFLFIDGDHRYESVKRDFALYSPMVRPGGLIAFHDIVAVSEPGFVREVSEFWRDVVSTYETEELVSADGPRMGIGLCRIPGSS